MVCLAVLLWLSLGFCATYYVSPSGSDDGLGSESDPWLTIQHAADEAMPGDTVLVREGVYSEQVFTVRSGEEDAYIVFASYPGETPVVDGTGVVTGDNGVVISHSYIKFEGFVVRNWGGNGFWVTGASFVEISDCEVYNVTFGVGFADGAHDFTVSGVVAHHFDLYGFDASPSGGDPCYNGAFVDCVAHTGRDPTQNVDGFALGHGEQHDFQFIRCTTYDVFDGFDISARRTTLSRCLAHDCWNGCYKLWQDSVSLVNCIGYGGGITVAELDWTGSPTTTFITNCTFFDAGTFVLWIENAADTLRMYNTIISGGDNIGLAFEMRSAANYFGDYNVFHDDDGERTIAVGYTDEFSTADVSSGTWTSYSGQDSHSVAVFDLGSLFVDAGGGDLHLFDGSVGVDAGTALGAPPEDFDGNPRPTGAAVDIGAYEYQPTGVVASKSEPGRRQSVLVAPNPTTSRCVILAPADAAVMIFDPAGRVVTRLPGGRHFWSPPNAPNSVYFVRCIGGYGTQRTAKIVVQR